jgi:hypothetical protein
LHSFISLPAGKRCGPGHELLAQSRGRCRERGSSGFHLGAETFFATETTRWGIRIAPAIHGDLLRPTGGLDSRSVYFAIGKDGGRIGFAGPHVFSRGNPLLFASRSRVPDSSVWTIVPCCGDVSGLAGWGVQLTLDFGKVILIIVIIYLSVNEVERLRRLIFIQATAVAVIAAVAVWKGHLLGGRLEGTLGANYSDPNDLALAIIISLPFCLALLLLSRDGLPKVAWALAILLMLYAVFLTGSRGGFISLIVTAAVFLWEFAIRGRRRYLLALAVLVGVILWQFSSKTLVGRLQGTFNPKQGTAASYDSAATHQQLFWRSVEITKAHPLFGVGPGNFQELSGSWHVTHNSFTQMSAEGGVPALVLYVLILWRGFKNLRATKRLARRRAELSLLARALLASLAGYVAGSVFLSVGYALFPYFLVAYTTALFGIAKRSATHSKERESGSQEKPEKEAGIPLQGAIDSAGWAP